MEKKKFYPSEYILITIGLLLYAIGWIFFWAPHQIVAGGIAGVSLMLRDALGISFGVSNFVLNIALIVLAIKSIGAHFGIKTVYASLGLSGILLALEPFSNQVIVEDPLLALFLGGFITGFGIGIVFSQGGSTGGTDIISMFLQKLTHLAVGRLSFYVNLLIISASFLVYNSLEVIIYGIVAMGISSYFVDKYLQGNRQSIQITIISNKFELIADRVNGELGRGITVYTGTGWYSRSQKQVISVIVRKREEHKVMKMVHEIDPNAFVSVSTVKAVYGEGFSSAMF